MRRSDAEIVAWVAGLFAGDPLNPATEQELQFDALQAAVECGLRGRDAIEAAMGAVIIEFGKPLPPLSGVQRIAMERDRQTQVEGWTPEHDEQWKDDQLALAAMVYAAPDTEGSLHTRAEVKHCWPWDAEVFKPGERIRELEKAGALLAAEIDRLTRLNSPPQA